MAHDDILGNYELSDIINELGPFLFLQAHHSRGDGHIARRWLKHSVARDVLPDRARVVRTITCGDSCDIVAECGDVLVLLRTWGAAADVWASARDEPDAAAVVAEVVARIPARDEPRRVDMAFTDQDTGDRHLRIEVRPWAEVRPLYAAPVQSALDELVAHRPAADEARRLVLWHGAPGTGKTTAIRALLHAWRGWADGTVVTDPEALLANGKYLRRTLLDAHDGDRWQLFVLEDAESLLHKAGSKGMGKLLNLADGLLGQGLRCLFLITTNEPLGVVHPALVRPGRCLARVEFTPLPAAQAAAVLHRPVEGAMTLAEVMAARPVSVVAEPVAVGQYL